MSTLEKDTLVWVSRDKLNGYLIKHHVPEATRTLALKIANMSFEHHAEAVILFLDNSTVLKNVKITCYMPIYKEMGILEKDGYAYEEVDGCISLPALAIENIRTITNEDLLFTVKDAATKLGYWREEYGIVALS